MMDISWKTYLEPFYNPDWSRVGETLADMAGVLGGYEPEESEVENIEKPLTVKERTIQAANQQFDYVDQSLFWKLDHWLWTSLVWIVKGPEHVIHSRIEQAQKKGLPVVPLIGYKNPRTILCVPPKDYNWSYVWKPIVNKYRGRPVSKGKGPRTVDELNPQFKEDLLKEKLSTVQTSLFISTGLRLISGENLLTTDDYANTWKELHRVSQNHFGPKAIDQCSELVYQLLLKQMKKLIGKGGVFSSDEFALIISRTVLRSLLGECVEELVFAENWEDFVKDFRKASQVLSKIILETPGHSFYHIWTGTLEKFGKKFDSIAQEIVDLSENVAEKLIKQTQQQLSKISKQVKLSSKTPQDVLSLYAQYAQEEFKLEDFEIQIFKEEAQTALQSLLEKKEKEDEEEAELTTDQLLELCTKIAWQHLPIEPDIDGQVIRMFGKIKKQNKPTFLLLFLKKRSLAWLSLFLS